MTNNGQIYIPFGIFWRMFSTYWAAEMYLKSLSQGRGVIAEDAILEEFVSTECAISAGINNEFQL